MTKWMSAVSLDAAEALRWLELENLVAHRDPVTVHGLLHDARDVVKREADLRSQDLILVPVDDEICIPRDHVLFILILLLRTAIRSAPEHGRVAITGQPMEDDVVFAVYDSGPKRTRTTRFDIIASGVALTLGGYTWRGDASQGNIVLLSLPLAALAN